jgi:hypothetical protein
MLDMLERKTRMRGGEKKQEKKEKKKKKKENRNVELSGGDFEIKFAPIAPIIAQRH